MKHMVVAIDFIISSSVSRLESIVILESLLLAGFGLLQEVFLLLLVGVSECNKDAFHLVNRLRSTEDLQSLSVEAKVITTC